MLRTTVKLPFDTRHVAFFGQPVAVVVASTLEAAAHGASLVEVTYAGTSQLTDIDSPQTLGIQGSHRTTPEVTRTPACVARPWLPT
jgi:xanthine dehydrogenase YagR molybdenum-binding subunit